MLLEVFYLLHLLLFTVALLHGYGSRASSSSRSRCCAVACLAVGRRLALTRYCQYFIAIKGVVGEIYCAIL